MKKRTISIWALAIIAALALVACSGIGLSALGPSSGTPAAQATLTLPPPAFQGPGTTGNSGDLLAAYQGTLETIYTTVAPSVVNVRVVQKVAASDTVTSQIPGFPFFNLPQSGQAAPEQYQRGLGSGFVWDKDGHIVTNNHVINGADKIEVAFSDGTIVPATLVGADPDSDLALLQVDVAADQLYPVKLADSNAVKVGQLAVAIGDPFGLEGSMTTGIISAIGRSLPVDETGQQSYTIPDVIQTDAPINPGNSGGVLVDLQGQVLGVTSAIESPVRANAGIGFAIPSAIVNHVIPALIKDGKYVHTWLGISGTSLIPDLATAMNLDAGQRGALVEEVIPNSPADKAGLQGSDREITIDGQTTKVGGDVITAIEDQPVVEMDDLIAYLAGSTRVDQNVSLTILRGGKQQTLEVTLAARPSAQERAATGGQAAKRGITLGIYGMTVNQAIAKAMDLPGDQTGVLVQGVEPGSLAETAGLRAGSQSVTIDGQQVTIGGDLITAINGQSIASLEELKAALGQLTPDQALSLTVLRAGKEIEVTVQPGQ